MTSSGRRASPAGGPYYCRALWKTRLVPIAREPDQSPDLDILDSREAGGRFVRGGGLRAIAYAGAVTTSIAAIPVVARYLHPAGYGRYVAVTSLLLVVAALTEGGIANLGVREFGNGDEHSRRQLMSALVGLRIVLSLLGGGGAILFAVLAGYPAVMVEGTAIACAGLVLANLQVTLAVPLTAALRLPWLALIDFVGPAVTAAALVLLVVGSAPLQTFFAAAVLAYAVTLTITAVLVRREIGLRLSFGLRSWRALLRESLVFAAATALGVVYFQLVVIAMSLLSSGHAVGVFSMAFRILSVVNGIPLVLIGSAFPILLRAARDDRVRLRYALQRLLEGNLLLGGWLSLVIVASAPFAVRVLGGPGYAASAGVLRILGAGVVATFLAAVFAFELLALRRYRALITINACMVALAAVLCITLIPADGARGGAFVTLSLEVVLAAAYGATLMLTQPELRPDLGLPTRMIVALGAAFSAALLAPLSSLLAAVAGTLVLVLAVVALRAVPRELLQALRLPAELGEAR
jgi:O-antigen/teichoic acid export membrane protein